MTALITMKDVLLDARCPAKWMDGVAQGALLLGMMLALSSIFVETQRLQDPKLVMMVIKTTVKVVFLTALEHFQVGTVPLEPQKPHLNALSLSVGMA